MGASDVLDAISARAKKLVSQQYECYREGVVPALSKAGIDLFTVDELAPTEEFLTEILGFRESGDGQFDVGPGGIAARLRLRQDGVRAREGAGGVHHVAWRVPDRETLLEWHRHLENAGLRTSGEVDRHYFRSLYFRIPGGVLFEIATDGPGMTADGEELAHLGETLALPPMLEPHRAQISADIKPLIKHPTKQPRHE
ncbi:hypothetical protein EON83_18865 [bacterium]|nr:MAG: hypothetical protein EON83_18865 [bacterium]